MNLWSHHFSQDMNEKVSGFLPCVVRAEILTILCSYFGRNDDFINSSWNCLTFRYKIFCLAIEQYLAQNILNVHISNFRHDQLATKTTFDAKNFWKNCRGVLKYCLLKDHFAHFITKNKKTLFQIKQVHLTK